MTKACVFLTVFALVGCEKEVEPYRVPKGTGDPYNTTYSEDRNQDGKPDYTVWKPIDPSNHPPGTKTVMIDADYDGFFDKAIYHQVDEVQEERIVHEMPVWGLAQEGTRHPKKMLRHIGWVRDAGFVIVISQDDYDFTSHKLTGGIDGESEPAKVDGVELVGTDGVMPYGGAFKTLETISEIQLNWGGEDVEIAKQFHINLVGLSLNEESIGNNIRFVSNEAGDEILMQAVGGDGGASFLVSLILRKDGNHRQNHQYWEGWLPSREDAWKIALEGD